MYPVLLRIGPVSVYSYGVLLAAGFALAVAWTTRRARRLGYDPNLVLDLALWVLLAGVVGARLVYVALEPAQFRSLADVFRTWQGGLSFHGGLAGALAAVVLFSRRRGIHPLAAADLLSPGAALGYAVARIGCFLNGCCYGAPTSLPWAVCFPHHLGAHSHTPPSHPAQLYA
ncbi:MAG: prolipoprotein diacylglyceryl transferase, partial [Armatimonadota bacterium]